MEVAFSSEDRNVARVALTIAMARVEGARPKLVELALPTMELDRLGAQFEGCAQDVMNEDKDNFDWNLELRLAMLVGLLVYTGDLLGLQKKEVKLSVDPEQTLAKLAAVERLRDEMNGQGRLSLKDRPEIQALTTKVDEARDKVREAAKESPANQLTLAGADATTAPTTEVAKKRKVVGNRTARAEAKKAEQKAKPKRGALKRPSWHGRRGKR